MMLEVARPTAHIFDSLLCAVKTPRSATTATFQTLCRLSSDAMKIAPCDKRRSCSSRERHTAAESFRLACLSATEPSRMPPAHLKGALVDKYAEIALFDVRANPSSRRPTPCLYTCERREVVVSFSLCCSADVCLDLCCL